MKHNFFRWLVIFSAVSLGLFLIPHLLTSPPPALGAKTPDSAAPKKYALLIGINQYDGKQFTPLAGARNDIELVKKILIRRFEMAPENITVLLDDQAAHTKIQDAFQSLADRLKPGDMVYIHYSGHGSYTCDLNGDEDSSWGRDSTWVAYGTRTRGDGAASDCKAALKTDSPESAVAATRSGNPEGLNDFDILDDQINRWLSSLLAKTDRVILVSDSCHSGTVTRGDTLATRGAPIDMRAHPMGGLPISPPPTTGVRISACRDTEKANEYDADGEIHGLFTWFWCKTLQEAQPGDTWSDLHRRTAARVLQWRRDQHPQIEGSRDGSVFDGRFSGRPQTATVTYVSWDGKEAKIDEGNLLGVTRGSMYKKYSPGTESAQPSTVTITRTHTTASEGAVQGTFQVGDQVVLSHYQNDTEPLKVLVRADLDKDQPLVAQVKEAIDFLPAYQTTDNQKESDFVLYIVRPKKEGESFIRENEADSLPKTFPDQPPVCFVLTPEEELFHKDLMIGLADAKKGIDSIKENLEKIARVLNLTTLTAAPGRKSPVVLEVAIYEETSDGSQGEISVEGKEWKKLATVTAQGLEEFDLKVGQLLTFSIRNTSDQTYYSYLVNITDAGEIIPFYPTPYQSREHGKIDPGGQRNVEAVTLFMDQPGREYIRLIASMEPIDIYRLEQARYRGEPPATKGEGSTPLDMLLRSKAGLTRSRPTRPMATAEWTTVQGAFQIGE